MDSSAGRGMFPCTYFTFYNRYSVHVSHCFCLNDIITYYKQYLKGDDSDPYQEPGAYSRPGKKKMNTAQFIPRASRELQESPELYHKLQENFEDMFDWQQTKAK